MKNFPKWNSASFIFLFFLLLGTMFFSFSQELRFENSASSFNSTNEEDEKQKGMHVFGRIDSVGLQPLIKSNVEWITLVPFGYQDNCDSDSVKYYHPTRNTHLDIDTLWTDHIETAHALGFKVFFKPHIWIYKPADGKWRSDIFPTNEKGWEVWKKSYREFISLYAKIAEKNNVELFCIGTEFTKLALKKPVFWKTLIQEIRSIYSGKITYAANWYNEYEKITFWDELDFIGVQAYFPLVKNKYPNVQQISKGWKKYLSSLKKVHRKFDKKILFTEMGYKSTPDSAIEPWTWLPYTRTQKQPVSTETQVNCYKAFFQTVWKKKWFAGVHIWQWHTNKNTGGTNNLDFTPRKKPAEQIIAEEFRKE